MSLERNFTSIPLQKNTIVLTGDVVNHIHDSSNACLHVILSSKACKLSWKEARLHTNDGGLPAFILPLSRHGDRNLVQRSLGSPICHAGTIQIACRLVSGRYMEEKGQGIRSCLIGSSSPVMEPESDEMLMILGSGASSSFGRKCLIARKGP